MEKLALAAAMYFDHELAVDPAPIETLWRSLAARDAPALRQWWATDRAPQKPKPLELGTLVAKVRSGDTVSAAVESTSERGLLVLAQTTPASRLKPGVPPRAWKYDAVVALGAPYLESLGAQRVVDEIARFADAVAAKAGIVVWSHSLPYASAIAMGSSGSDLTREQAAQVTDMYVYRSHWGRVIRGPEWGTFLSATHVGALGDASSLPAAKVTRLASGGAFVQLTPVDEPVTLEAPIPALAKLRDALETVLPH